MSNVDQIFKMASNLRSRNTLTTLQLVDIYRFTTQYIHKDLAKVRMCSVYTEQRINHFSPQYVALCLADVRFGPVFSFPVVREY